MTFLYAVVTQNFQKKNKKYKYRKPSNLMLIKAINKWSLKKNIVMMGNKLLDKKAAKKTNIKFYYKKKKQTLYIQIKKLSINPFNE